MKVILKRAYFGMVNVAVLYVLLVLAGVLAHLAWVAMTQGWDWV